MSAYSARIPITVHGGGAMPPADNTKIIFKYRGIIWLGWYWTNDRHGFVEAHNGDRIDFDLVESWINANDLLNEI